MTYCELRDLLMNCKSEHLDDDVTIRIADDEFLPVFGIEESCSGDPADGILDHGHLYLDMGTLYYREQSV